MAPDPFVLVALAVVAIAWLVGLLLTRRAKSRRRAALKLAGGVLIALYVVGVLAVSGVTR